MPFHWSAQSIDWFQAAGDFTGYHKELAALLASYFALGDSLCDVGCGLGMLDLELAHLVSRIEAIDTDPAVIRVLQERLDARQIRNVHAVCGDAGKLEGRYDTLIMSFYGGPDDILHFLPYCGKRLIHIVNQENAGALYPSQHRRTSKKTAPEVETELKVHGLRYECLTARIEFGQPLRSRDDGLRFVRHHAPNATPEEIDAFLAERLRSTDHRDFPLYLPNFKNIAIFIIESVREYETERISAGVINNRKEWST